MSKRRFQGLDTVRRQFCMTDFDGVNISGATLIRTLRESDERRSIEARRRAERTAKKMSPKNKKLMLMELLAYAVLVAAALIGVMR